MSATLNIRNLGAERKAALEREAQLRNASVADVVREYLDAGLKADARARAQAEWIEAARPGIEAEREYIERHGMLLAEYRRV
ncbi:MAG: type II toxin-antitoxin system CcdA family antitoxin [Pseudomonadota bacterium]